MRGCDSRLQAICVGVFCPALLLVDVFPTERTPPPDRDPGSPAVHLSPDMCAVHPGGAPRAVRIGSWHGIPESSNIIYIVFLLVEVE